MPPKTIDPAVLFLWVCLQNSDYKNIDFDAVAAAENITIGAARKRFSRLKLLFESGQFTTSSESNAAEPGPAAGTTTAASTATPAKGAKRGKQTKGKTAAQGTVAETGGKAIQGSKRKRATKQPEAAEEPVESDHDAPALKQVKTDPEVTGQDCT